MTIDPLSLDVFKFPCPSCKMNFYKSLVELVMNEKVACSDCGHSVRVSDYYKKPDLEKFLVENGYENFILGMRE